VRSATATQVPAEVVGDVGGGGTHRLDSADGHACKSTVDLQGQEKEAKSVGEADEVMVGELAVAASVEPTVAEATANVAADAPKERTKDDALVASNHKLEFSVYSSEPDSMEESA